MRPLPFVVHKVLELAKEDPVDFQAMSRTVASDQTLSALIISVANSAGVSNRYKQITSLKQAMIMLGRQHVVQIVIAYTFQTMQTIGATKWPLGGERFWKHCLAVGTMASQLAVKIGLPYPEEAFIAGLVHDIGKIIMLNEYKTPYAQLLQSTRNNLMPLFLNEKKIFGCHHAEVGAALCIRWKIPSPLTSAVEEHHVNPTSVFAAIVNLVGTANRVVKLLGFGDGSNAFVSTHPHAALALTRLSVADKIDLYKNLGPTVANLGNMTLDHEEEAEASPKVNPLDGKALYLDLTNPSEQEFLLCLAVRMGYTNLHFAQSIDDASDMRVDLQNILITDKPEKWSGKTTAWHKIVAFNDWRVKQPAIQGNRVSFVRLMQWLEAWLKDDASPAAPPAPEPEVKIEAEIEADLEAPAPTE
ncbi:MAG: HDOD domain-containing protein [Rhodothermales bacterium]